jgi:uncharacterized protein
MSPRNPFEFGRELSLDELVDREAELAELRTVLTGAGKCFLIGPRRYGKTSLLAGAAELAGREKALVLRYDGEVFPTLDLLASRLVRDYAGSLAGPAERVGKAVRTFFKAVKPSVSFKPLDGTWSVSLGMQPPAAGALPILLEVLDGYERAARSRSRPTGLILDEFQRIVDRGGADAEGQLRAAVQTHRHLAYIFAGSETRVLAAMTGEASRPFYRLGERRFLGPIPRPAFRAFLARGLKAVLAVTDEGVEAILDRAEDVPYNVQLLAHVCWEAGQTSRAGTRLTPEFVAGVEASAARRNDPLFTQLWTSLTAPQQKALLAVIHEAGKGLASGAVSRRYRIPVPTLQKSVRALEARGIVREEGARGEVRLRLEDPLFGAWVRLTIPWEGEREE